MILSSALIEEVTFRRLQEKLENHIKWGYNCDSVKEALEFHSEWLLGGFGTCERNQVEEYLIHNGFYQKGVIEEGRKSIIWYLNQSTTNPTYQAVIEMYKNSLQQEEKRCEEEIRALIKKFLSDWYEITIAKTESTIYRNIIVAILSEKKDIKYAFSQAKDWIVLSKTGNFKGYPEKYDCDYEDSFRFWTRSTFKGAILDLEFLAQFNKTMPEYLKISICPCYKHRFKDIFEKVGFSVQFMPVFDEEQYFKCGIYTDSFVTFWLKPYNVKYCYIPELTQEANKFLQKLCEYF